MRRRGFRFKNARCLYQQTGRPAETTNKHQIQTTGSLNHNRVVKRENIEKNKATGYYDLTRVVPYQMLQGNMPKNTKEGTNVVLLDPDVAKVFKTPRSVNQALRSLAEIIKAQKQKA